MLVFLLLLLLLHHEISQQEIDLGQELDLELCSFSIGYSLNHVGQQEKRYTATSQLGIQVSPVATEAISVVIPKRDKLVNPPVFLNITSSQNSH